MLIQPIFMPALTILAGPSGAGKTRFSEFLKHKNFLSTCPVNLDLLREEVINDLSYDSYLDESKIGRRLDKCFEKLCKEAISEGSDFSYECNLRKDQVKYVKLFEESGYQLNLIYLTLRSIELSKSRIEKREANEKFPRIQEESILKNFHEGLKNLDDFYQDFNQIVIIDNSVDNSLPKVQVIISDGKVRLFNNKFPYEELSDYLPKISDFLRSKR